MSLSHAEPKRARQEAPRPAPSPTFATHHLLALQRTAGSGAFATPFATVELVGDRLRQEASAARQPEYATILENTTALMEDETSRMDGLAAANAKAGNEAALAPYGPPPADVIT